MSRLDEIKPLRALDQWKGSVRIRYVLITAQELDLLKRAVRQLSEIYEEAKDLELNPHELLDPDILELLDGKE